MRMTPRAARLRGILAGAAIAALAFPTAASAQGMTPMRGEIKSFTDQFAVRVFPMNPYGHRIKVEVKVYDETFAPVAAHVTPAVTVLAPNDNRGVYVVVPFEGRPERKIRVCTEAVPYTQNTQRVRTQVCGKFLARRVG